MEIQLQELIDQIKKDGVASAEAEAAAILKAARDEADVILSKARADADQMVQDARAACKREAAAGEDIFYLCSFCDILFPVARLRCL